MNKLTEYLVPYMVSQVVAVIFILIAYKNTRVTRLLFAIVFLGAAATNMTAGLKTPEVYLEYSSMALPFYRDFINGWFSQNNHIMIPAIAAGQALVGIGMLLRSWWVKWACIGAIIFLLGITPLMVGSAFPFTLFVAWAAWVVLNRDSREYLWASVKKKQLPKHFLNLSPAVFLSWVSWMFTVVAVLTGLFAENIYRDNEFVQTAWRSNDWVTLIVVVPSLLFVLLKKNNVTVQLLWAGLLGYLVYNYTFYLLGAAFNVNFLVYVAIIASSTWSLVAMLQNFAFERLKITSNRHRWISLFLFFIAAMLAAVEIPPATAFLFERTLPELVAKTNHPTSVVYALDLTIVVPTSIVAGYWLWRKKPWGIVLSSIMLVKAAAYGIVLIASTFVISSKNIDRDPLLPFYFVVAVGGIGGLVLLLKGLRFRNYIKIFRHGREYGERVDIFNQPVHLEKEK